ncbi:LytTR family DNA-binding domain-containing protein [Shewanella sp. SR44-3]|uniref:LytR/AlgR family response regulator transcription factor n=1 Tax=Shewanella sp. SR44-3 TaxID=2760936 RepID=UPI0015F9D788|nr:LytTR family DNA-binding domain-containing protein [Shewanella sp. SR44-3]MBB1269173.1 response regulator transcription factor [Shewanella sp. SR44-3]
MKIAIIEDEPLAAEKLAGYIQRQWPEAKIIATLSSVDAVIEFFNQPQNLDLLFSDIELSDGQVFSALEQIDVPCPVIFTTSYNDYWMNAFQNQGIEYLLKPFSFKRFSQAVTNYQALFEQRSKIEATSFKQRFIIKQQGTSEMLNIAEIHCFRAANGTILAGDKQGQYHILSDNNLSQLEAQLDPKVFFRINRADIININSLIKFETYTKETLALYIKGYSEALVTSKTRTANFRKWLEA